MKLIPVYILVIALIMTTSCEEKKIKRVEMKKTQEMMKDDKYDFKSVKNFEDAANGNLKILFQNDALAMYELEIEPGGSIPPHRSGNRFFYSLNESDVDFHLDNVKMSYEFKPGQVQWQDNTFCRIVNPGKNPAKFLVCEKKGFYHPENLQPASPEGSAIFSNSAFTVKHVNIQGKASIPENQYGYRLIYPISECKIEIKGQKVVSKDSAYWFEPDKYSLKNNSDEKAQLLVIDVKK